ncbi:MAG: efflux RND transporter periplasmic adaptor subunit [Planctomycetes bacterium]|nr:efflux RND transporter periplasmic adaptor subunit [Planctomycetota bacterium]
MTSKRKRLIGLVTLIIVGVVVTGVVLANRKLRNVVQTGHVERIEVLDSIVSASGEIRAKNFVDLQTEIAGVIVDLPVKEGDRVKQGDVLLRIDPFQTRQDVASAQAQYDAAMAEAGSAQVQIATAEAALARDEFVVSASQSELTQTESNRDRLKSQLDRKRGLYEKQVISIDDFEAAESALKVAESQVVAAQARVEQSRSERDSARVAIDQWKKQHEAATRRAGGAQANLERMQDLLSKTTIVSPLSGVITKLNVEKGERAVPGILSNPQATLMTIADLSTIEAEIKVDETDIINVSIDDPSTVTVDALPDVELKGHVTEIGNSPIGDTGELTRSNTNQEGKDFKVVVRIDDPPASLRPGLSASAEIFVDRRENVLVIPLQAVTVREVRVDAQGHYVPPDPAELERAGGVGADAYAAGPPRDDRKTPKKELEGVFVFVRDVERARFRPVKLGIKGESDVEVLEGLSEGDEIVTGSYKVLRVLKDYDLVKVENHDAENAPRLKRSRRR